MTIFNATLFELDATLGGQMDTLGAYDAMAIDPAVTGLIIVRQGGSEEVVHGLRPVAGPAESNSQSRAATDNAPGARSSLGVDTLTPLPRSNAESSGTTQFVRITPRSTNHGGST